MQKNNEKITIYLGNALVVFMYKCTRVRCKTARGPKLLGHSVFRTFSIENTLWVKTARTRQGKGKTFDTPCILRITYCFGLMRIENYWVAIAEHILTIV